MPVVFDACLRPAVTSRWLRLTGWSAQRTLRVLIAETPIPDVPASIRADILAEVTAAIADAQSQRAQTANDIADMKTDFATARGEAADGIAEMKADVATAVDEARTATIDALAAEKNKVAQELSAQVAALTADIAQLVTLTNADRTKIIAGDLKAQQDAAAAVVKIQQANAALVEVFTQVDIDLQSQRDQIVSELQSAIAQRQQAWDVQTLKIKSQIASFLNLGVSESDATYWGTFFGTFVASVGETFVDGRAWDSLQGATTQMLDVMAIGITDFSEWIHPLYGHHGAHEAGTYVGTVWGTANWIAISFFSGGAPSGGANQAGLLTRTRRFFYDNRNFRREISPEYWGARGGANGHSLHHWLFPQRAGMPQGIQNAGFNLINLPPMRGVFHRSLDVNTWMGWARNWGPQHAARAARVENGLRIGIPALGTGTAYVGYEIGDELWKLLNGGEAQ